MTTHYPIQMGPTDVAPEAVGYNPAKLELLDAHFARLIDKGLIQSASYLLARHGKVFAWRSQGPHCGFEDRGAYPPDAIRPISSVSKVFTAIAIMKLIEDGQLYLEQPVSTIIKEFDTSRHQAITLFHLLTHTSGLPADPGYWKEPYPLQLWDILKSPDWIRSFLSGPLQSETGKFWSYCSIGFVVLGEVIARVSGLSYPEYVTEKIIRPLGMTRTFFKVPEEYKPQVGLVTPREEQRLHELDQPGFVFHPLGAGGIFSSLHDYWKLGQMILNRGVFNGVEILGRKTIEAMTRNHLPNIPAYHWGDQIKTKNYALGMEINKDPFLTPGNLSHEGAGRCALWLDPAEEFIYASTCPTAQAWSAEAVITPRGIAWSGIR